MANNNKSNKNKNKKNRPNNYSHKKSSDIKGIIGIAFSLLLMLGLYTNYVGYFSVIAKSILISLLGFAAFIVPVYMLYVSYTYIVNKGRFFISKNFYIISIVIANTMILVMALFFDDYYDPTGFFRGMVSLVRSGSYFNSGILGYMITYPLVMIIGKVGTYLVSFFVYLICIILYFNVTLESLGIIIRNNKKKKQKMNKDNNTSKVSDMESNNEGLSLIKKKPSVNNEEAIPQKGDFIKGLNSKIRILDSVKDTSTQNYNNEENLSSQVSADLEVDRSKKSSTLDNEVKEIINKELNEKLLENRINKDYTFPVTDILKINSKSVMNKEDKKELLNNATKLEETLNSFGVDATILQVIKGPSVTRYELQPSAGVKVSKIVNLSDDIALSLASSGIRMEAPIPGKSAVGIEVPNRNLTPVFIRELLESKEFIDSKGKITFALGKDIAGKCVVGDLSKMPHMLIAGATGSGKSVCINTLIISLLYKYSPDNVKILMIDPKVVELNVYNGIPHLLIPVVTDPKKAAAALNWAVNEMTRRYKLFADSGVRNIETYNELFESGIIEEKLPSIVIIVDELADLMMACPKDVEDYICRLAQMARAAGMHLVIATQRPSVDVITGVIKANIPSRISFAVSSQIDSRTILDSSGAEKLLGKGDMLYYPSGFPKPLRVQGCFISESEVEKVVDFIKSHDSTVQYHEEIIDHINNESNHNSNSESDDDRDELLDEAIRIVVEYNQVSASFLQRKLKIGFNRAARIMEQLETFGVISKRDGNKPRQILFSNTEDKTL